jgi:DNA-binding SARP family transcriptional activator
MRFRILGPLEVLSPDGWTAISAAKWRSLLAVLLLRPGQLVPTETLVFELWGDNPPSTANNLVSIYVHRLKKVIGDTEGRILVYRAPGYMLRVAAGDLDIQQFESLAAEGRGALAAANPELAANLLSEALSLWRGRLLADVQLSPLLETHAERVTELWFTITALRIAADLERGRAAHVIPELRGLVDEYPLHEPLWVLLMRALEEAGRRAEALEVYAQARQVIADELGVDPGSELQRLYTGLLAVDASPNGAVPSAPPAMRPRQARGVSDEAGTATWPADGADAVADAAMAPGRVLAPAHRSAAGADAGDREEQSAPPGAIAIGTFASASDRTVPAAPETDQGPGPVAISRPAQLPADTMDFTGREAHAAHLWALLVGRSEGSPDAVRAAVVNGAAGLGKTALAVHVAHQVLSWFPDGQLYVDLLGPSQHPANPAEVLARFLRDLGVESSKIPAREDERAALYRTVLADRRVLIVLDNARDAAQVRQLLPGSSSCAVLVTTRNRTPDLTIARFVELDVLEDTEALALFTTIVGEERAAAEPDATAEVLIACAGLPLAIRICAARLAARSRWQIATLAGRLRGEHRRLDELTTGDLAVRASVQVSYDSIRTSRHGTDPARAFRLLGLWQGASISLSAAAALIGEPDHAAAEMLESLVDTGLLESPAADWYCFHDLLRVYAMERAQAEEPQAVRDEAVSRLLWWYLDTAQAAADTVSPHRYQIPGEPKAPSHPPLTFAAPDDALAWYDDERGNIVAAARQAADDGLLEVATRLPPTLFPMFNRRSNWADCVTAHRVAAASAAKSGDRLGQAWALNNLGYALVSIRDLEAFEHLEQSLALRHALGDTRGEAQTAIALGEGHLRMHGPGDVAVRHLRRAADLLRPAGASALLAAAVNNLGETHYMLGDLGAAAECYAESSDLYRKTGGDSIGHPLHNLGRVYLDLQRIDDAAARFKEAVRAHRSSGDLSGEAFALKYLGQAHSASGDIAGARVARTSALAIFERIGDQEQVAEIASLLAELPLAEAPEALPVLARSDRPRDNGTRAGQALDSESPVHGHREALEHYGDGETGSAAAAAGPPAGNTTAGAQAGSQVASGDRAGEDLAGPPAAGETLLAALRATLMTHGVVEREQAAAWSAALVQSWPEPSGTPGIPGKADRHPAGAIPDASGYDTRPDPLAAKTPADFVEALNQLRKWAGNPPYRIMEERCGRAAASATICTALTGDRLPRLPIVLAIVAACYGEEEDRRAFTTSWRKIEMEQETRQRRGKQPPERRLYPVPETG